MENKIELFGKSFEDAAIEYITTNKQSISIKLNISDELWETFCLDFQNFFVLIRTGRLNQSIINAASRFNIEPPFDYEEITLKQRGSIVVGAEYATCLAIIWVACGLRFFKSGNNPFAEMAK